MKSYLRFLSRNKLYTAIMAVGLSVSLAFVIIMSCFVWQNMNVNRYYPDQDRMYAVGNKGDVMSNLSMAQIMSDAIPEIECATSIVVQPMEPASIDGVELGQDSYMGIRKGFFEMFPMKFYEGNPEVLNDPNNAIITRNLAAQFGGKDIIGKTLIFQRNPHSAQCELTIAAVIEDFDDTIFANEQIVVNIENKNVISGNRNFTGSAIGYITVIRPIEGVDESVLLSKMDRVYEKDIPEKWRRDSYLGITRLDKVFTSDNNDGGYTGFKKGKAGLMTAFSIIVVFLLISAIFNYINLSTALAGRRNKEIATRRLLGESGVEVSVRNLYESLGFMLLCMVLAFILAHVSLPYVNMLLEAPIPIEIRFSNGYVYMYLIVLGLTALLCGIIPAVIAFRFNPIEITKGAFRYNSKRVFSKLFIIAQSAIAIIIVSMTLVMNAQIRHMIDMPLNANTEGLYLCETFSGGFEKTLMELPYVSQVGRSDGRPGEKKSLLGFALNNDPDRRVTVSLCYCDSTAFALYGFKVVRDYGVPKGKGAWLTESAMRKLEINPENPVFPESNAWVIGNEPIAGIIEDVPFSSALDLNTEVTGIVMSGDMDPDYSSYVVCLTDTSREVIRELDNLCETEVKRVHGPDAPMVSGYIPELIEKTYDSHKKQITMVIVFMVVAILLSALGQVAMSTYYATEREKEIGIRKVFGGTVRSEICRNIFEYMGYTITAAVIAVPAAVLIAERYLETFVYRMNLPAWIFLVATLGILAISLLSILWQTLRAARTNPAEALKKE